MRRIGLLMLPLTFGGCAFNTWWNPPFTTGYNPNVPVGDSENIRRVMGNAAVSTPLTPEPGDIWPGPLPPTPTLQQLERESPLGAQPELPVPGSPISRGAAPPGGAPYPSPQPAPGSSTPPGSNQPPLTQPQTAPPLSGPSARSAPPPARGPGGQIYQTPGGPAVTNGGGPGYQTTTTPGGGSAIIVPNGNGTSTIIHSDGRIETVPTPH
jgi:hypothetical protein